MKHRFTRKVMEYSGNIRSYLTDYFRLVYVNKYDNCFYCDTDVLVGPGFLDLLRKNMRYGCFCIECTGTFLYNRRRDSSALRELIKFYDDDTRPFDFDAMMDCHMMDSFIREKGELVKMFGYDEKTICHMGIFSKMYWDKGSRVSIITPGNEKILKGKKRIYRYPVLLDIPLLVSTIKDKNRNAGGTIKEIYMNKDIGANGKYITPVTFQGIIPD